MTTSARAQQPKERAADLPWKDRLEDARQRMVFSPTPEGAKPHYATLERLAETLDAVEVTGSIAGADSPTDTLCRAMALVLREMINARMYDRNMQARIETGPDRVDVIDAKLDGIVDALSLVLKHAFPKKKQEPQTGQQHGNGG